MSLQRLWTGFKVWVCYLLPFLPCVPRIGKVEDADCMFVQAFGRNGLPDEGLGRFLHQMRNGDRDDIDTFGKLVQHGFDAGASNKVLAQYVMKLYELLNIPIIAQWEVVYAMMFLDSSWYIENLHRIDCIWPPEDGYFATKHVKTMSKECMLARGCCRPLEVAHPAMIARAVPVIWKLGMNPVVVPIFPWSFWEDALWAWDKDSIQPWTRGFRAWVLREPLGRVHHILHRWVGLLPPK